MMYDVVIPHHSTKSSVSGHLHLPCTAGVKIKHTHVRAIGSTAFPDGRITEIVIYSYAGPVPSYTCGIRVTRPHPRVLKIVY